ncbi:hypothetical protein ACHAWT_002163 [Skeletonema menzelii]
MMRSLSAGSGGWYRRRSGSSLALRGLTAECNCMLEYCSPMFVCYKCISIRHSRRGLNVLVHRQLRSISWDDILGSYWCCLCLCIWSAVAPTTSTRIIEDQYFHPCFPLAELQEPRIYLCTQSALL